MTVEIKRDDITESGHVRRIDIYAEWPRSPDNFFEPDGPPTLYINGRQFDVDDIERDFDGGCTVHANKEMLAEIQAWYDKVLETGAVALGDGAVQVPDFCPCCGQPSGTKLLEPGENDGIN